MPFMTRGILVILLCLATACVALPTTSRTGTVHAITIAEEISPRDLEVQPGDEVQWVNRRGDPVWVYFFRDSPDELSCQRGFSYDLGTEEVAKVEPDQSVSLCFANAGAVEYLVQRQPTIRGGVGEGGNKISGAMPGVALVGSPPERESTP